MMKAFFDSSIKQEVSRCLLCYDPPCSKACPAQHKPDRILRSLFFDNPDGAVRWLDAGDMERTCPQGCNGSRYCQNACVRRKIDRPVDIQMIREFVEKLKDDE